MKGFTLIELIVVILIVGILAAIAYPAISGHHPRERHHHCLSLDDC